MQYIDLQEFEDFMRQRNLVAEKYVSYYVSWVRRFLLSGLSVEALSQEDQVQCFANQLARDDSVQEWQQRQALDAVKLYLDVYLREVNAGQRPLADEPGVAAQLDLEKGAEEAAGKMRELLRMRHYAYTTEKSYMGWLERYYEYVSRQGLDWKATGSVRIYLSHLALSKKVASSTQNQAFSSLLFLFQDVLQMSVETVKGVEGVAVGRLLANR